MRPKELKSKIFLDSGDPKETKKALEILGFLDGQTTNPSLMAKNPEAKDRLERGEKISQEEMLEFYKETARKISEMIPRGSVSLEVYADEKTTAEEMFEQGKRLYSWIDNAHLKYPITFEGLKAAEKSLNEGMRVNMTLVFSLNQAKAIGVVGKNVNKGDMFISPFVGRLDDIGEKGMALVKNIIGLYRKNNIPVEVLTASLRNLDHLLSAIALKSDILTSPLTVLSDWAEQGLKMPAFIQNIEKSPSQEFDMNKPWQDFNLNHQLTDKGIKQFAQDWDKLIK